MAAGPRAPMVSWERDLARFALYTTVHPGSVPFLQAWHRSVRAQADQSFDLWIGLDSLEPREVMRILGVDPNATWVNAPPGASPTKLRSVAIERIVEQYDAAIFSDSDDLLEPGRVGQAREALGASDVAACAMRLIDDRGMDLQQSFRWPTQKNWNGLARANAFGLGNSAYRSETLKQCLPIPRDCVMEDWFLATRCWARRVRMRFDGFCGVAYRQHRLNMTSVRPPFDEKQLVRAVRDVQHHYHIVLNSIPDLEAGARCLLEEARANTQRFSAAVMSDTATRRRYLSELNRLPANHVWFDCVAHPSLTYLWKHEQ